MLQLLFHDRWIVFFKFCVWFSVLFFVDIDFDSILGQLSSLDDQFNDLGDDESSWYPSKPLRPTAEWKAPVPHSQSTEFKYTEIADDFGDISSHLLDVISELDQLVDSNVGSESEANRSSVEAHRAASSAPNVKEVRQCTVGPGHHGRDPPPLLHKPLSTDGKRPIPETVKNQKPSSAVRTSVKSDVCNREEGASLRSSSDSGSSSSVTQSIASSRLSGRSAAFENLPQVYRKISNRKKYFQPIVACSILHCFTAEWPLVERWLIWPMLLHCDWGEEPCVSIATLDKLSRINGQVVLCDLKALIKWQEWLAVIGTWLG